MYANKYSQKRIAVANFSTYSFPESCEKFIEQKLLLYRGAARRSLPVSPRGIPLAGQTPMAAVIIAQCRREKHAPQHETWPPSRSSCPTSYCYSASHELTYVAMVTSNRNENLARDQITVLNSVLAETHAVVCIIICVNIYNNNLTPEFIWRYTKHRRVHASTSQSFGWVCSSFYTAAVFIDFVKVCQKFGLCLEHCSH